MKKNVALPFKTINSVAVSQTSQVISSVSTIAYVDNVGLQMTWAGNPQGTFDVQGSVDWNLGVPPSGGGRNLGTWTSVTLSPAANVSGSSSILINMSQLAFPYMRLVYTNSTGSGVISAYFSAKSLG